MRESIKSQLQNLKCHASETEVSTQLLSTSTLQKLKCRTLEHPFSHASRTEVLYRYLPSHRWQKSSERLWETVWVPTLFRVQRGVEMRAELLLVNTPTTQLGPLSRTGVLLCPARLLPAVCESDNLEKGKLQWYSSHFEGISHRRCQKVLYHNRDISSMSSGHLLAFS